MATAAVVIPVYATPENRRLEFLAQTLKSVQQQTYRDIVAVIVDDGSTVDVAGFVQAQRMGNVRYVRRTRSPADLKTASNALNLGIDLCLARSGEVFSHSEASDLAAVAYLHSDDLLPPASIQKRISVLDGDTAFVHGDTLLVSLDNNPVRVLRWKGKYNSGSFHNFPHHTIMWTIEFALQLKSYVAAKYSQDGIFDSRLSYGEDRDVSLSSAEAAIKEGTKIIYLKEIAYLYKQHLESISGESPDVYAANQDKLIYDKHGLKQGRLMAFFQLVTSDFPWSLGYSFPELVKRQVRPLRDFVKQKKLGSALSPDERRDLEMLLATPLSR